MAKKKITFGILTGAVKHNGTKYEVGDKVEYAKFPKHLHHLLREPKVSEVDDEEDTGSGDDTKKTSETAKNGDEKSKKAGNAAKADKDTTQDDPKGNDEIDYSTYKRDDLIARLAELGVNDVPKNQSNQTYIDLIKSMEEGDGAGEGEE